MSINQICQTIADNVLQAVEDECPGRPPSGRPLSAAATVGEALAVFDTVSCWLVRQSPSPSSPYIKVWRMTVEVKASGYPTIADADIGPLDSAALAAKTVEHTAWFNALPCAIRSGIDQSLATKWTESLLEPLTPDGSVSGYRITFEVMSPRLV